MENIDRRIRRALDRIEAHDEALHRELLRHRERDETRLALKGLGRSFRAANLTRHESLDALAVRAGRPVLKVFHDEALLTFEDAESEVWRDRLLAAKSKLIRAIRAAGRVELHMHGEYTWFGTAWLVRPNIVVTNQHVAHEFATRVKGKPEFRLNKGNKRMGASVDFMEEFDNDADSSRTFRVGEILRLEDDQAPDIALLRVEPEDGKILADALTLATEPARETQFVAAIGYPARDGLVADQELMERLFRGAYNKKRLSPGQITGVGADVVQHDCCTLSGSSGSPIVDLETGEVVALHFAGANLTDNFAVPAALIAEHVDALERGLPFRNSLSRQQVTVEMDLAAPPPAPEAVATVTVPIEVTVTVRAPVVTPGREQA